ncbi:MAG: excinuclease ABC subunit UvrC [Candidatus Alcyoniella australis]|nr:excinuclease ABC subunit UvrC [Candidatus Alcyoniella australis]
MRARLEQLAHAAASFPLRPGVYLFRDEAGRVIYVGKAKALRNRVRSYFSSTEPGSKTEHMLARAAALEFIVLPNETEALRVENELIKKYRPRYNVRLRDDKTYAYLRFNLREQWPRPTITRRVRSDGALYYGPFTHQVELKRIHRALERSFPLRKCTDRQLAARDRPCINGEMGRCLGPCSGADPEQYARVVSDVRRALGGSGDELAAELQLRMEAAAENLDFERAAQLRDQVEAVRNVFGSAEMVMRCFDDLDAVGLYRRGGAVAVALLFVRAGRVLGRHVVDFSGLEVDDEELLSSFISRYYLGGTLIPPRILVPLELPDAAALGELLSEARGARVELSWARRGRPRELVRTARENAEASFEALRDAAADDELLLESLQKRLRLKSLPRRIECYDVSNTGGMQAVASQVTFVDARPDKALYRRYKIKDVPADQGGDVAMLRETLLRRGRRALERKDWPDLLVIDGGRGQVAAAQAALDDLEIKRGPELIGLAKPNERELARGEARDKVYLPGRVNPLLLPKGSDALFLLMRLRDEAHRFALAAHRKQRGKASLASALDGVPGLGPKRKRALLRHFGSVERIRQADVEQLSAVPGVPESIVRALRERLEQGG